MSDTPLVRFAEGYAKLGAYVFPCALNKQPLTPHGFKDATLDLSQIRKWWNQTPEASIGVACGASRWFVLDIDADKGGFESFVELQQADVLTAEDLATFTTRTGSGGLHIVWTLPEGVHLGNSAGKLGKGLDTRGEGGYIIVPPSDHPSGNKYAIELNKRPRALPMTLLNLLTEAPLPTPKEIVPPKFVSRVMQRTYERVANAAQGTRNDTLNKAGFYLFHLVKDGQLSESDVRETLYAAALRAGLEQRETLATINSAYRGVWS